ncbi:MAG: alkaline phosphatase family protein [Candidatus Kapaibacteriales bacterium]
MKRNIQLIVIFLTFFLKASFFYSEPYVLLISIDGFRWDYLQRGKTPNLKNFADQGVQALSLRPAFPSSTFPNHYTIITGLYPENHNIIGNRIVDKFRSQTFSLGDTTQVRDALWYVGEAFWETARRNGIITASYFWPGSEINIEYRRPNYFKYYNPLTPYEERIQGVIQWLQLPKEVRPHFITLYFELLDAIGHRYGPNSKELDSALNLIDNVIGNLLNKLKEINLADSLNIIVISDHGMTEIDTTKIIDISNLIDDDRISVSSEGYIAHLNGPRNILENIYLKLKANQNHFKVYWKKELPLFYHYSNNPFIGELLILPEHGWNLTWSTNSYVYKIRGNHGYDHNWIEMHGIFIAKGPLFKEAYKVGTLWNVDIYPLLCRIFQLPCRSNLDGRIDRIEFILK